MAKRTQKTELNLTLQEQWIIDQTLKTWNLDLFTEYFFRLPNSGTRWMPGDSIGHYRHIFHYDLLYDGWTEAGRPEEALSVKTPDYQYQLRVLWQGDTPHFLLPHGYLFLNWARPVIDRRTDISLVIAGTGTSKTSSVAIAMLTYCALIPGYSFMNGAPTDEQSQLMIDEMEKWVSNTAFRKLVIPTVRCELFIKKPSALVEIASPLNPLYPSRFVCKTTGRDAKNALGKNLDCACLDEIQFMENIDDITDKFATRFRAQRPTGEPRDGKMILLTNPGDNPNLGIVASKIERLIERNAAIDRGEIVEDKDKPRVTAVYIKDLDSSVNLYITKKQRAQQEALMDAQSKRRWLQGMIDTSATTRIIPPDTIQRCVDKEIDDAIRIEDKYDAFKIDGLGIISYAMPREDGRTYIVVGDPGHTAPTRISYNNVGIVLVLDVTDFLTRPCRLVYFDMVIDEKEAQVVRQMYEWVAYETMTLGQVTRRLAELKIPRMSEYDEFYSELNDKIFSKQKRWTLWSRAYLANLIRSPLYRGEWQYGKDHHKRIDTPQGIKNQVSRGTEVISVQVPAIVTNSLWQMANEQLLENRKKFYRKSKREYLLRGRLWCGVCGSTMSGSAGYYKCQLKSCERRNDPAHNCDNGYLWYEAADEAVWSTVRDAMLDENRLWGAVNRRSEEALKVREALETSLTAMQLRIQREQDKIGRLLDLYAAGDLDRETYLAKCKTIEDGITSISVQAQDLEKRLAENPVILPDQEEALRIFQREISSRMTGDVPMAEKRKLLDLLRVEASWDSRTKQLSITGLVVDALLSVSR